MRRLTALHIAIMLALSVLTTHNASVLAGDDPRQLCTAHNRDFATPGVAVEVDKDVTPGWSCRDFETTVAQFRQEIWIQFARERWSAKKGGEPDAANRQLALSRWIRPIVVQIESIPKATIPSETSASDLQALPTLKAVQPSGDDTVDIGAMKAVLLSDLHFASNSCMRNYYRIRVLFSPIDMTAEEELPLLVHSLRNRRAAVRAAAAETLGMATPLHRRYECVKEALKQAQGDPDAAVRRSARDALNRIERQ